MVRITKKVKRHQIGNFMMKVREKNSYTSNIHIYLLAVLRRLRLIDNWKKGTNDVSATVSSPYHPPLKFFSYREQPHQSLFFPLRFSPLFLHPSICLSIFFLYFISLLLSNFSLLPLPSTTTTHHSLWNILPPLLDQLYQRGECNGVFHESRR